MNIDRANKKKEEMSKRRESYGKDFYFPKKEINNIRFLPHWTWDLNEDPFYETMYHKNLGDDKKKSVICLKFEKKEYCPGCEAVDAFYHTRNKDDAAFAKSIRAQTRVYWNIVDLDDLEAGVQVWMTGSDILDQVIDWITNPKYGDITDPIHGRNCTLRFTKGEHTKSGWNEYKIQPDPTESVIEPAWFEHMVDLTTFIKITPADEMKELIYGKEIVDAVGSSLKPEEKPATTVLPPSTPSQLVKTCFENAKFSGDDEECLACPQKTPCKERKQAKKSGVASTPLVSTAAVSTVATSEKSKEEKESEIRNMLAKIKTDQKK